MLFTSSNFFISGQKNIGVVNTTLTTPALRPLTRLGTFDRYGMRRCVSNLFYHLTPHDTSFREQSLNRTTNKLAILYYVVYCKIYFLEFLCFN